VLREEILSGAPTVPLKTLHRFLGKAIWFTRAFPGATFFIREIAAAIGSASSAGAVRMTSALSEEIAFGDSWTIGLVMSRGGWKKRGCHNLN